MLLWSDCSASLSCGIPCPPSYYGLYLWNCEPKQNFIIKLLLVMVFLSQQEEERNWCTIKLIYVLNLLVKIQTVMYMHNDKTPGTRGYLLCFVFCELSYFCSLGSSYLSIATNWYFYLPPTIMKWHKPDDNIELAAK